MKRGLQGRYETVSTVGETVKAFIPSTLPPFQTLDITGICRKSWMTRLFCLASWVVLPICFQFLKRGGAVAKPQKR